MTYYDRLNEFFNRIEHEPLKPSAQLVYLHLLHINRRNTGAFYCTDGKLMEITQLSKDTITQAKRHLKNIGLIDFKTDKRNPHNDTLYIMPQIELPDSQNSKAVLDTWHKFAGGKISAGMADYLIELENQYGAEKLKQAIIDAVKGCKYDYISYNYLKAVLENKKGGDNGTAGQYSEIVDDEVPEGY